MRRQLDPCQLAKLFEGDDTPSETPFELMHELVQAIGIACVGCAFGVVCIAMALAAIPGL